MMCLTFFGQAMASSAMSYHMFSMKEMSSIVIDQVQPQSMAKMNHANHSMMNNEPLDNSDKKLSEECCGHPCDCYKGSCSTSAVALIKNINNNVILHDSSKIQSPLKSLFKQQLTSLYRPPILS